MYKRAIMLLPPKVFRCEIPGNLWQGLRREGLRRDREPEAILLQVLIDFLNGLGDRDAPPAARICIVALQSESAGI